MSWTCALNILQFSTRGLGYALPKNRKIILEEKLTCRLRRKLPKGECIVKICIRRQQAPLCLRPWGKLSPQNRFSSVMLWGRCVAFPAEIIWIFVVHHSLCTHAQETAWWTTWRVLSPASLGPTGGGRTGRGGPQRTTRTLIHAQLRGVSSRFTSTFLKRQIIKLFESCINR
jgi:hypothetical protein